MNGLWVGERTSLDCSLALGKDWCLVRQRWKTLVLWLIVCNCAAFAYFGIQVPQYVATIQVLLQPLHIANDGPEDLRHFHQFALDSVQSETDRRIIRSERVLRRVFDHLDIAADPDVSDGPDGIWATAVRTISRLSHQNQASSYSERAFLTFSDRVRSRRIGLSYIIEISYRASRPAFARRVVSAVAASYLHERILTAMSRLQLSGPYKTERLQRIRDDLASADSMIGDRPFLITDLPSADARVLGLTSRSDAPVYPKLMPLVVLFNGFGLISGACALLVRSRIGPAHLTGPDLGRAQPVTRS